jgi:nicotinamide mononucleotide transporter
VSAGPPIGRARLERALTIVACLLGALLLYASWRRYVETDLYEALGFVTGGACVWLGVKQNVWNWPIGIANNAFYVVVFLQARLFADMSLQVAFALLGAYGWYAWIRRNARDEKLAVTRTPIVAWVIAGMAVTIVTAVLTRYLSHVNDAAPFLDALTTALSLGAQYLMTRKYLECWWIWIAVDVVSVGLYAYKHLELTALLYALFMAMCVVGLRDWKASLSTSRPAAASAHA